MKSTAQSLELVGTLLSIGGIVGVMTITDTVLSGVAGTALLLGLFFFIAGRITRSMAD